MPSDFNYNEKLHRIENIVSGTLSRLDLEKSTGTAIALQREHGAYSVLINAADLVAINSVTDIYELPKQYAEQGASRASCVAIVMPKTEAARKAIRFYETVCINRGWTVQSFETQGDADDWLQSKQPKQANNDSPDNI